MRRPRYGWGRSEPLEHAPSRAAPCGARRPRPRGRSRPGAARHAPPCAPSALPGSSSARAPRGRRCGAQITRSPSSVASPCAAAGAASRREAEARWSGGSCRGTRGSGAGSRPASRSRIASSARAARRAEPRPAPSSISSRAGGAHGWRVAKATSTASVTRRLRRARRPARCAARAGGARRRAT